MSIALVAGLFVLVQGVIGHVLPGVTRPDVFFGVTVDPAFRQTDQARRILRRYRAVVWAGAFAALVPVLMFPRLVAAALISPAVLLGALVTAHRAARAQAPAVPQAPIQIDLSAPEERAPGGLAAWIMPFVLLGGLGAWAFMHPDALPRRLVVHWGLHGADRWVTTGPRTILVFLLGHGLTCLLLTAVMLGMLHASRRIATAGPAAAAERQARRRLAWMLLTTEYFLVLPPAFSLLQAPALAVQVWIAALLVTLLAFVVSLMRAGQGGTRLVAPRVPGGDHTPDDRWIGGLLYVNPADPALFVEKRMGIGWTFNFGNPWCWLLLAVLLGVPICLSLLQ